MTAPVQTIDFAAVFADITEKLEAEKARRILPPTIRLLDGDMNLRGYCKREDKAEFQFLDNETGVGVLEMPADYYLSKWALDVNKRRTTGIHVVVDKDGARWSGFLEELHLTRDNTGRRMVRLTFKHDYDHLKHILAWSNPFLPAEFQFPRLFVLWGRARWVCKTALLLNLMRLENSAWAVPSDPLQAGGWFDLDLHNWTQVVKPDLTPDTSISAVFYSRFKNMHEATTKIVADAQLSWECRRYLDGDPEPWPGANLAHGTLVWDLVDKSGWNTGTSFGGTLFEGLVREFSTIGGDGLTTYTETVTDPNFPDIAFEPGKLGTDAAVPAVIFREGEHTGIQSSELIWRPEGPVGMVGGGTSAPGVNELIGAGIELIGDLTAMIPGAPPLGGVANELLKPVYSDVVAAFGKWKNNSRADRLGRFHLHEKWVDGSDRAYTLEWLLAMRTGAWQTRESLTHTVTVADGAPWSIGENGKGHFFLGDRVGVVLDGLLPGQIFVDRVSSLTLSWDRSTAPSWAIQIGARETEDPVVKLYAYIQELRSMIKDLGLV